MDHSPGNAGPPPRRGPSVDLDPHGIVTGKGPDRERRQFLNYAFYRLDPVFRRLPAGEQRATAAAFVDLVRTWQSSEELILRTYSLVGLRADVDFMGATILLGFVFLIVKYFEYSHKFHDDLFPSTNNFLAIYFTLTGLHMLHVAGGMAVNAYFWGPGAKLWKTNPRWFTNRVEHSGLFWHFVDLVWIFLFPTLYLL